VKQPDNGQGARLLPHTRQQLDWSDVKDAAEKLVGNWREFDSFVWHRAYDIEDADQWFIWYTGSRDAGLLEQSNEKAINERLEPFTEGDDPDLVFESHSQWAVGHIDGFSIRVRKPDGSITPAFEEFCRIKEERHPGESPCEQESSSTPATR